MSTSVSIKASTAPMMTRADFPCGFVLSLCIHVTSLPATGWPYVQPSHLSWSPTLT
jgi:hypothetical protein